MKIGSVVVSLGGHDIGEWFLVAKVDKNFVYVCDGKNRPLQKPKKKNKKHVCATKKFCKEFEYMINSGSKIQNAFIRKTLKFFKEQ